MVSSKICIKLQQVRAPEEHVELGEGSVTLMLWLMPPLPRYQRGNLQLFHQMGPDPVPETHRGVKLIIRSLARMADRQHSKKHSQNTVIT